MYVCMHVCMCVLYIIHTRVCLNKCMYVYELV